MFFLCLRQISVFRGGGGGRAESHLILLWNILSLQKKKSSSASEIPKFVHLRRHGHCTNEQKKAWDHNWLDNFSKQKQNYNSIHNESRSIFSYNYKGHKLLTLDRNNSRWYLISPPKILLAVSWENSTMSGMLWVNTQRRSRSSSMVSATYFTFGSSNCMGKGARLLCDIG